MSFQLLQSDIVESGRVSPPVDGSISARRKFSVRRRTVPPLPHATLPNKTTNCVQLPQNARFDASRHPAVLRGHATVEEVSQELLDTFFSAGGGEGGVRRTDAFPPGRQSVRACHIVVVVAVAVDVARLRTLIFFLGYISPFVAFFTLPATFASQAQTKCAFRSRS